MNWLTIVQSVVLQMVLTLDQLCNPVLMFETHFMDSYCSSSASAKSQTSSGAISGVIQLGKESCNSVALLRSYRTDFPNNGMSFRSTINMIRIELRVRESLAKCEVNVKAPSGYGLIAVLEYASFRPSLPCDLQRDELIVSLNKSVHFNISHSDGQDFATDATDNDIAVKFVTTNRRDPVDGQGFQLVFTAFKQSDDTGLNFITIDRTLTLIYAECPPLGS